MSSGTGLFRDLALSVLCLTILIERVKPVFKKEAAKCLHAQAMPLCWLLLNKCSC